MAPEFGTALAEYACPLVNPPAQRHLFENKLHNLQLAIGRMQGHELAPGAEFSFWELARPPTLANGYREGAMFINHAVSTSVGGGLCQLSGLLYNLALLSGLRIRERHNHSIDAYGEQRYIPLGRDATVAHGRKDLRFANPHPFPVRLELRVDAQRASGTVLGAACSAESITIDTRLLRLIPSPARRRHDPALARGQQRVEAGLEGKVVEAWRVTTTRGGEARREFLSRDHYRATPTWTCERYPWPVALGLGLRRLARR